MQTLQEPVNILHTLGATYAFQSFACWQRRHFRLRVNQLKCRAIIEHL